MIEQRELRAPYSVVCGAKQRAVACHGDARYRHIGLRDELVRALVRGQIPHAHGTTSIAGDYLALVGMDDDVIHGRAMVVVALHGTTPGIPDLHGAVLGARNHPLALAVEGNTRDIAGVALEGEEGIRIRRLDVEEFDGVVPSGGEESLIGGDAESIDLRVRVLYCARTYSRECFPESVVGVSVRRVPASFWVLGYAGIGVEGT